MRLAAQLLTATAALLMTARLAVEPSGHGQQPTPSAGSQPMGAQPSDSARSLARIRAALERPPGELLKVLSEKPTFRVEIRERQRFEDLIGTLTFDSGPPVPGGRYHYFPGTLRYLETMSAAACWI